MFNIENGQLQKIGNLNSDKMNNRKMNEKIKIKYNNNVLTSEKKEENY